MVLADVAFTTPGHLIAALRSEQIRFAIRLSLISSTISAVLSVWVGVSLGYILSRWVPETTAGQLVKGAVDSIIDIPIVLPPLVIGLSLLILFRSVRWITYETPSVVIAQLSVAAAFAVRAMKVSFDQISPRTEQVALTLGCTRGQAFWRVGLPEASRGVLTAFTLAWARSLGEFGPILVFSGATRMRTEVLPTTVFLELSVGNLEAAVAVSLLMIAVAVIVLLIVRLGGASDGIGLWRGGASRRGA
jgi:molybdate transport system permease protein